ncbi:hypothetical protein EsH8_III_000544 [Colletotrichum jinshuiense]
MPRPSRDRVILDCTSTTLPLSMVFVLVIFTILALVYSIRVKTPIPKDLAVTFAGIVCGLFGLWLLGHLYRYFCGHYTQGIAGAPDSRPLPLTAVTVGADGTGTAAPFVPMAATSLMSPINFQQQHQQHKQHNRNCNLSFSSNSHVRNINEIGSCRNRLRIWEVSTGRA